MVMGKAHVFHVGSLRYIIYFWSNEGKPRECLHVHISKKPTKDGTKVWILSDGSTKIEHNKSQIPVKMLKQLLKTISDYHNEIENAWKQHFQINNLTYKDKNNNFYRK